MHSTRADSSGKHRQQEMKVERTSDKIASFFHLGVLCAEKGVSMKKYRGEKIRPCVRCEAPIRYVKGTWTAYAQRRHGWHWENEDGTHHRCSDFVEVSEDVLDMQWQAAIERDNGPYDAERASVK